MSLLNINLRTLRILALVENAPRYGRQLELLAPELFFSEEQMVRGKLVARSGPRVYTTLGRIEKEKLIEKREDYSPPASMEIDKRVRSKLVWYGITSTGRKALREARQALGIN